MCGICPFVTRPPTGSCPTRSGRTSPGAWWLPRASTTRTTWRDVAGRRSGTPTTTSTSSLPSSVRTVTSPTSTTTPSVSRTKPASWRPNSGCVASTPATAPQPSGPPALSATRPSASSASAPRARNCARPYAARWPAPAATPSSSTGSQPPASSSGSESHPPETFSATPSPCQTTGTRTATRCSTRGRSWPPTCLCRVSASAGAACPIRRRATTARGWWQSRACPGRHRLAAERPERFGRPCWSSTRARTARSQLRSPQPERSWTHSPRPPLPIRVASSARPRQRSSGPRGRISERYAATTGHCDGPPATFRTVVRPWAAGRTAPPRRW